MSDDVRHRVARVAVMIYTTLYPETPWSQGSKPVWEAMPAKPDDDPASRYPLSKVPLIGGSPELRLKDLGKMLNLSIKRLELRHIQTCRCYCLRASYIPPICFFE